MMDTIDAIIGSLEAKRPVMVATVIATSGSTPAAAFSRMVVTPAGTVSAGTVGGGCMEGDVLLHASRLADRDKAEIITFQLQQDDIEHGLICGGSLDVLIEPITWRHLPVFSRLKSIRDNGKDAALVTFVKTDGTPLLKRCWDPSDTTEGQAADFPEEFPALVSRALHRMQTTRLRTGEGEWIVEPVPGRPSLIIFGGGHVSKFISRAASMTGFLVTVVDDREQYAHTARFPEAARTVVNDFHSALEGLTITPSTYVVVVTRGHQFDEEVLAQVITTPATYIGMIGSRRKVLMTFKRLAGSGVDVSLLRRVHAPIGLDIGAVTAEEIAVSIVAELIRVRRGNSRPLREMSEDAARNFTASDIQP